MGIVSVLAWLETKLLPGLLSGFVKSDDFVIPPPKDTQPATDNAASTVSPDPVVAPLHHIATGPSSGEIVLGVVAALAAAGIFFLLRGVVYNYLIERRVSPSAARGAGWAFFTFLLVCAWATIAGFVVGLWSSIPFSLTSAIVAVATLIFFLASFFGALKKAG